MSFWTLFAASGQPSSLDVEWTPVESGATPFKSMSISQQPRMIDLFNTERLAFWDSLYDY